MRDDRSESSPLDQAAGTASQAAQTAGQVKKAVNQAKQGAKQHKKQLIHHRQPMPRLLLRKAVQQRLVQQQEQPLQVHWEQWSV